MPPTTCRPVPLTEPRDGVPAPLTDPATLAADVEALAAGSGPVAVDAERASGYRYGQRAYLVQLRRAGAGTVLDRPASRCPTSAPLGEALADAEWVLHAASQDLPCLAEVGLRPGPALRHRARPAGCSGYPRVGLGAIVEEVLGLSAGEGPLRRRLVDPPAARAVAALRRARRRGARRAARRAGRPSSRSRASATGPSEEFAAVVAAPPPPPRVDPWRRTSGLHRVRKRRQLAVVRALWERRDEVARRRDIAPGRVLPDAAIVAAALAVPPAPRPT